MPRYHFHIQLADRLIVDEQGIDLPDLRSARGAEADEKAGARWADVLQFTRRLPHRTTIITDERGRVLFVLAA
jgi:hypothetical protein